MKVLDLHGKQHNEVESMVDRFITNNPTPLEIITGNSDKMKSLVKKVCKELGKKCNHIPMFNAGCVVITENYETKWRKMPMR